MLRELKDRKNLKLLTAALTCGVLFAMGGQAEAAPSLYGTGTTDLGYSNSNVITKEGTYVNGDRDKAAATGSEFTVTGGEWDKVRGGVSVTETVKANKVTISEGVTINTGVCGGYNDGDGISENNEVIINGGAACEIIGGISVNGVAKNNTVTVNGGKIYSKIDGETTGQIFGGDSVGATGNAVTINDGEILVVIYGGQAVYAASGNTVTINGGTMSDIIYGGVAASEECNGSATGNTVIVNGGEISEAILGGFANGSAIGNRVTVNGGEISGDIYGGAAASWDATDSASGNIVTINGGAFTDPEQGIYGGSGSSAINNTVNIGGYKAEGGVIHKGNNGINLSDVVIYGGKGDISEGNTLNVFSTGNKVKEIVFFQNMNFYLPKDAANNAAMLEVTGSGATDLKGVAIRAVAEQGSNLQKGNSFTLIDAANGIANYDKSKSGLTMAESMFKAYQVDIAANADNTRLVATVTGEGAGNKENLKSPVETMAASIAMLTAGGDMLAGEGLSNAAASVQAEAAAGNPGSMAPFAAMGGASSRLQSGSYVNLRSWNINLGAAKEIANSQGRLIFGPVLEYGRGSYDSHLDNGVRGDGKSSFFGGGIMAKQTNRNDFYYEGSLRYGRIRNDYSTFDNTVGTTLGYDVKANYLAAHLGVGKIVQLKNKDNVDVYGKLFYAHQNGADTMLAGNKLSLDAVDSFRTRLGARYNHRLNSLSTIYGGLAWQYEFNGKAEATYNGDATPAPSVKGHTGILELGWRVKPGKGNFETGLGFTGSIGKQKGVGVNASFQWSF